MEEPIFTDISEVLITFMINDEWDEKPGTWKTSEPVSLSEIIDRGMNTQIDFLDGGYVDFNDIKWSKATVLAKPYIEPVPTEDK